MCSVSRESKPVFTRDGVEDNYCTRAFQSADDVLEVGAIILADIAWVAQTLDQVNVDDRRVSC